MIQIDQGSSLSNKISNKLKGNALRGYKQSLTLNTMQREVIVGTLLGDACMPLDRGKPRVVRRTFAQKSASADYIQHLYSGLRSAPRTTFGHPPSLSRSGDFVGTPPQVLNIRGSGARDRQCMWFRTYGHLWST